MTRLQPLAALLLLLCASTSTTSAQTSRPATRFVTVDIFIETASPVPLAAYQLECRTAGQLVGVEGGDGVFARPPYYDPKALAGGRVILAGFTLADDARPGKIRVARLHLQTAAGVDPACTVTLSIATNRDGVTLAAVASAVIVPAEGAKP